MKEYFTVGLADEKKEVLRKKMLEYRERAKNCSVEYGVDARLKLNIVVYVLVKDGKVGMKDLREWVEEAMGVISSDTFEAACGVIADYCTTGGENTYRGKIPTPSPA